MVSLPLTFPANGPQLIGERFVCLSFLRFRLSICLGSAVNNGRLTREHVVDLATQVDEASSYFDRCLGADVSCKKMAPEVGQT